VSTLSGERGLADLRQGSSVGSLKGVVAGLGVAVLLLGAAWAGDRGEPALVEAPPGTVVDEPALGGLPVTFVENRGQLDPRVRYYAQGSRYAFFFTPEEVVLSFEQTPAGPAVPTAQPETRGVALALQFRDASPDVEVRGADRAPGHVNYLRGDDPGGWRTGLAAYESVVYRELWPGIDAVLYEQGGELKYEFRVRPGANPADIGLAYAGAGGLAVDDDGALRIATAVGELRDAPPVSWQVIDGVQVPVDSGYVLQGDVAFGFAVGAYDPRHELVIDPGLDFSTYVGGSWIDNVEDIAVDGDGNVYITGDTGSTDFPTTTGAFQDTRRGSRSVFVTKLSADGSRLEYSTYLGGTPCQFAQGGSENSWESGKAIAVDDQGHAYVTGVTTSDNFPTTSGAFQPEMRRANNHCQAAFVTKLNPSGTGLVYSTFLGGTNEDAWAIALDEAGSAYVTGRAGSGILTSEGAFQEERTGTALAVFVTKLTPDGSDHVYTTLVGGGREPTHGGFEFHDNSTAEGIAVDAAGNAYVAGSTRDQTFPTTPGAFMEDHPGGAGTEPDAADIELFTGYAFKLNPTGTDLAWSTFLGTNRRDFIRNMALDADGHVYVSTGTLGEGFPTTPGTYDPRSIPGAFISKFTADGSDLVWSTRVDFPTGGLVLDDDNNLWLHGGDRDSTTPTTPDAFSRENAGLGDAWFGQFSADGTTLLYGSYFGGSGSEGARALARDAAGAIYLAGNTSSHDLPTTEGAFQTALNQPNDLWVAKFGEGGAVLNPPGPRPTSTESWSGRIRRDQTIRHFVNITGTGEVRVELDWDEPRTNLVVGARVGSTGEVVYSNQGGDRPKDDTFTITQAALYEVDVRNATNRHTDYTLRVTYPTTRDPDTPPALTGLSLNPSLVTGGETSMATVTLSHPARAEGEEIELSSSNLDVAPVPLTLVVPAGETSATFAIETTEVDANTTAVVSASFEDRTREATLTINAADGIVAESLSLSPNPVQGGNTSTGTVTLSGPAPAGGAEVFLSSSNTANATVPASLTVPAGQTSGSFTISTPEVSSNQSSAITARHGGVSVTRTLSITSGPPPELSSVSLDPSSVPGGNPSTGTVTLTSNPPLGGIVVELESSDPSVASVPSSVTAVNSSASFQVSTTEVSSDTSVTITASANGVTRTATLTVTNPTSQPSLSALSLNPTSVEGGSSSTGTVALTAAAPSGGASVALSSNNIWATVPSSVTVPAGATSATFTVSTSNPDQDTIATITGSYGGATRTASLNIARSGTTTTTSTFSGQIRQRDGTITHTVSVGAAGRVDYDLRWDESRVDLTLRVRDPGGSTIVLDATGGTRSTGSFDAPAAGSYRFEITNPSDRRTDYTLAVTHPAG
jgi:hypothetical protein